MLNNFYVYRHIRLDKGTPFYIGKGKNYRAASKSRNEYWHRIVNKYGYKIEILRRGLTDNEACDLECKLIAVYQKFGMSEANFLPGGQSNAGTNNPMFGKGYKLTGPKNGRYGTIGSMRGKLGLAHPRYGIKESTETRAKKKVMHLGEKHPKHKWNYNTPKGFYTSITLAAKDNRVSISSVKARCRSNNFPEWSKELAVCL